jgi:DNA-binding CsgD family transcriptional regulator
MPSTQKGALLLEPAEIPRIEATTRALDLLPSSAHPSALFEAIRPCVPLATGLFCIIRPSAPDTLVSHAVGLPQEVFESWLGTSPEQLAWTLAPVISSEAGGLWRDSETITGEQREQLDVLRMLDRAGLGEGAGYKVLERPIPWQGVEHFMMALLMERGVPVPSRSQALLAALNPAICAAVLRLGLLLVAREPLLAQIVEEQSLGYICVSTRGAVLEANRRAHHLVMRYRDAGGITGRLRAMADFAARARDATASRQAWYLTGSDPPSLLEVNAHRLAKETHALPEDVFLLVMKEIPAPPLPAGPLPVLLLARLTPRQREVALLLARTGLSYKQIAEQLSLTEATARKHGENVHRVLGVHSRAELTVLLK